MGFSSEPELHEIVSVAHEAGLPFVDDLGSGTFLNTEDYGLDHEMTVQESLDAGDLMRLVSHLDENSRLTLLSMMDAEGAAALIHQLPEPLAVDAIEDLAPDAAARTLGHIGYFDRSNFVLAFDHAGFRLLQMSRPSWYFGADYLLERVNSYLPGAIRLPVPNLLGRLTVRLNLRDSLLGIFTPKD